MTDTPTPQVHPLKTWPEFFAALADGSKTFEIRRNDRAFRVGDTLLLEEWDPETGRYSGRTLRRTITYITDWEQCLINVVMGLADDAEKARGDKAEEALDAILRQSHHPALDPDLVALRDQRDRLLEALRPFGLMNIPPELSGDIIATIQTEEITVAPEAVDYLWTNGVPLHAGTYSAVLSLDGTTIADYRRAAALIAEMEGRR